MIRGLFASTAAHYARYRPVYPDGIYAEVVDQFGLDGSQRALDLGCGPGTIAIPIAAHVAHVIAVDPEPTMLAEGRARAGRQQVTNVSWLQGDSASLLSLDLPPIDLCLMGRSFHWMDRQQVLADLDNLLTPHAGLVILSAGPPGSTPLPSWADVIANVRTAYLGTTRRAGNGVYPEPEEVYVDTLARSAFTQISVSCWDQQVSRTLDELVGLQFSNSYSTPAQLGDRMEAFDKDLRRALTAHDPSGRYEETITTEVLIATRP